MAAARTTAAKTAAATAPSAGASMYAKQLAAMKAAFNAKKEDAKKGRTQVPNNTYLARLSKVSLKGDMNTKDADGNKIKVIGAMFTFVIVDGDYAGEKLYHRATFETEDRILYFMRDLGKLGVDLDGFDITNVEAEFAALNTTKPAVRLRTETNGDFINIRILEAVPLDNEQVEANVGAAMADPSEEPGEDPTPEPVAAPKTRVSGSKPPPKGKAVATAAPEPDPEPTATDEDPEPTDDGDLDPEPEGVQWEVGDSAQFKAKGAVKVGMVKEIKDGKLFVREANSTTVWPIPLDYASLVKMD